MSIRTIYRSGLQFLFFSLCLCVSADQSSAQDFKQLHPGVEYAQVETKLGSDPVKINLLRLDLKKVRLDVHHALDKAIGLETTSSIAKRKNAVAAINAGFFRLDKSEWAGDAAGLLMIDGVLVSESTNDRTAVVFRNQADETAVGIGKLVWNYRLKAYDNTARKPITLVASGINRERRPDDLIIYTPHFGPTTRTSAGGLEIVLRDNTRPVHRDGEGNSEIPAAGFVISASGKRVDELKKFFEASPSGSWFHFTTRTKVNGEDVWTVYDKDIEPYADAVAGVPQLIKNGKIDITWEQEKASKSFVETRHPRTAVAKLKDGKFLMMTVDGRQPGVSVGMSLQELAEYLFSLGAVDAMNLDGGGSTTMFLDGKVVNTPSDKEGERKIGDAIVVTQRKPAKR